MEKDDINLNKIGCDKIYENISQLNELFYSLTDSLHNFNISTNIEVNRIATIANKLRSYSIYNNEKFIVIEDDLLKELTNFISNQLHNIFSNEESNKIFDKEFDNIFQIFKRIDEDIITKKTIINIEDKEIEEYNDKTIMQLNEIIFSIIDSLHNFNISTNTEVNNRISYVARKLRDYFKGFITLKEELFNELSSMISFDLYEVFNTNTFSDELFDSFVSIFKKIDKYNSEIRLLKSI